MPGRTVLLTTHYMAEADELCERIAIVDHGRILAIGTPDELKHRVQRESIFRLELDRLDGGAGRARPAAGRRVRGPGRRVDDGRSSARPSAVNLVLEEDGALGGVVGALGGLGAHILALRKSEPIARGRLRRARRARLRRRRHGRPNGRPVPATVAPRRTRTTGPADHDDGEPTRASWSDDVSSTSTGQRPTRPQRPPTGPGARCC